MKAYEDIHPVDRVVGQNLRAMRVSAGVGQQALGEAIGVSFQQVQKYERGLNRVSASMLYEIANHLGVPLEAFFAGLRAPGQPEMDPDALASLSLAHVLCAAPGGRDLARAYLEIPKWRVRESLLGLIRAVANDQCYRRRMEG